MSDHDIHLTDEQFERVTAPQRQRDQMALQIGVAVLQLMEHVSRTRQQIDLSLHAEKTNVEALITELGGDPDAGMYVLDRARRMLVCQEEKKE